MNPAGKHGSEAHNRQPKRQAHIFITQLQKHALSLFLKGTPYLLWRMRPNRTLSIIALNDVKSWELYKLMIFPVPIHSPKKIR